MALSQTSRLRLGLPVTSNRIRPPAVLAKIATTVDYQDPAATRDAVAAVLGAGFTHVVLSLGAPCPDEVSRWVADQIVIPSLR